MSYKNCAVLSRYNNNNQAFSQEKGTLKSSMFEWIDVKMELISVNKTLLNPFNMNIFNKSISLISNE